MPCSSAAITDFPGLPLPSMYLFVPGTYLIHLSLPHCRVTLSCPNLSSNVPSRYPVSDVAQCPERPSPPPASPRNNSKHTLPPTPRRYPCPPPHPHPFANALPCATSRPSSFSHPASSSLFSLLPRTSQALYFLYFYSIPQECKASTLHPIPGSSLFFSLVVISSPCEVLLPVRPQSFFF